MVNLLNPDIFPPPTFPFSPTLESASSECFGIRAGHPNLGEVTPMLGICAYWKPSEFYCCDLAGAVYSVVDDTWDKGIDRLKVNRSQ